MATWLTKLRNLSKRGKKESEERQVFILEKFPSEHNEPGVFIRIHALRARQCVRFIEFNEDIYEYIGVFGVLDRPCHLFITTIEFISNPLKRI